MSTPKVKHFPIQPSWPPAARAMQSCAFILAANWVFQGMRGMDRKELGFRLGLEALVAFLIASVLIAHEIGAEPAAILALLLAHTASFLFNGQLWVCARYCRAWHRDPATLEAAFLDIVRELRRQPWLDEAVAIGSRGDRGAVRGDRSDLDVRIVVPEGIEGLVRANLLLIRLRTEALLGRIPLDIYAYDEPRSLDRFDQRERLLVLLDRRGRLERRYPQRVSGQA
ncbi:MAG: hypothetical protein U1E45_17745 [Geminicoccaceae bacterium]